MVFYSGNFTFNNVYSQDLDIYLVSDDNSILNDYGIPFTKSDDAEEITLSFCYASENIPLKWEYDTIVEFLSWIMTDDFCEFISEDNEDIIYFLKGVSYKKRFTNNMTGVIDVTFKTLSSHGYKHYIREILKKEKSFEIYNYSNVGDNYKPVITLSNINSTSITLTNETTNKQPFYIGNLTNSDIIYIDNLMGTITDSNGNNRLTHSNRSWIELTNGSNIFSINGNCDIRVEAYYPMMV